MKSILLDTIKADLAAGVSFLEGEAETIGLDLWNILKGAFIALEPIAAQILMDALTAGVTAADASHSIEQIESAVLNAASSEVKAALKSAGSGIVQTIIAAIRAQL